MTKPLRKYKDHRVESPDMETLEWVKGWVDDLIKRYGPEATLEISTDYDGGVHFEVQTSRLETQKEMSERVKAQREKLLAERKELESRLAALDK